MLSMSLLLFSHGPWSCPWSLSYLLLGLCTLYISHRCEVSDSAIITLFPIIHKALLPCSDLNLSQVSSVLSQIYVWQNTKCIFFWTNPGPFQPFVLFFPNFQPNWIWLTSSSYSQGTQHAQVALHLQWSYRHSFPQASLFCVHENIS